MTIKTFDPYPEIKLIVNVAGNIVDVNRKALNTFKMTIEQLRKHHINELFSLVDFQSLFSQLHKSAYNEIVIETEQIMAVGNIFPAEIKIALLPSTINLYLIRIRDITARTQVSTSKEKLQLINSIYTNIFKHIPDGIIIVDIKGVIKEVNTSAELILGEKAQELVGKELGPHMGISTPNTFKMMETGHPYNDVELIISGKESNIHTVISGIPIRDKNEQITGGVIFLRPIKKVHHLINRFIGARAVYSFKDIIAVSPIMKEPLDMALKAASSNSHVLLEGESGTGKEVFAQAIHNEGQRRNGPFVAVNCGAIPRDLIGSELFGYAEGAFTGARKGGSPGKFELASGGTLFLDEIGDMPLEQQVTLLRVLQEKSITRIGDSKAIPIDVRIICATNKNLWQEVEEGNFRADLYYRLNVINISIPPLRQRIEDIPILFEYFLSRIPSAKLLDENEKKMIESYLKRYNWPGNIREMQNVVERMAHLAGDLPLQVKHLPPEIKSTNLDSNLGDGETSSSLTIFEAVGKQKQIRIELERDLIVKLLKQFNNNVSMVAREMGVDRSTIYRKMKRYKIE